jgi:hypothetical protein
MKKIVFALFFTFVIGNSVFAQYLQYGILFGADVSTFDINYQIHYDKGWCDYRFKTGFRVGLEIDYTIIPNMLYMASELAFAQRGANQKWESGDTTTSITYQVNYLQMPINILYKYEINDDMKLLIFTGPYIGYALSSRIKTNNKIGTTGVSWKNTIKDYYKFGSNYKSIDLGLNAGIGIEYYNYFLKLQYNHSLINLLLTNFFYQKNQNIGISVGYIF